MTKRILFFLIPFVTVALGASICFAQAEQSFADLFNKGTQSYKEKKFEQARDLFSQAVQKDPNNVVGLTNLALSQFQLGNKAHSLGLLRKVLALDPDEATAKAALKFVLSQTEIREIPHQIEAYESLRSQFLAPFSLATYLFLTALFLFVSGWSLLSYMGHRNKAVKEEQAMPRLPIFGIVTGIIFGLVLTLAILKQYDLANLRATIIDDKVSLQTAPGANQVTVLDLYGGMEVVVNAVEKDWVQITYPGSLTGWVKSASLIVTSGQ